MARSHKANYMAQMGLVGRKPSDAKLARNIAHSIREHADAGIVRHVGEYTNRAEMIEAVNAILKGN